MFYLFVFGIKSLIEQSELIHFQLVKAYNDVFNDALRGSNNIFGEVKCPFWAAELHIRGVK